MICRSAVIPTIIGLGAAAVVAAGGASAVAGSADPTLGITVTAETSSVGADKEAKVVTKVVIEGDITPSKLEVTGVKLIADPAKGNPEIKSGCDGEPACNLIGADGKLQPTESVVKLNETTITDKVTVTMEVTVAGTVDEKAVTGTGSGKVIFAPLPIDTSPPPSTSKPPPSTTKPPPTSKTTTRKPSASSSGGGNTSSGSGGAGGSGGSGSGGSSGSGSTGGYIPPAPNSSFDPRNPQVALPPITSPNAPNPSVAPGQVATPQSRLQGNKAPVAQDLTFERMASTQIAWLAALMVAFSLLLTQARLGRKRMPAAAPKRTKGEHRRPRRGSFGK
ncbi:hypothetical protein E1264_31425 [Actinomadura sp. KC216]|uniref:hypothetical protein n=1 Tax=Actinomadura sp. KC216 TaxID=2530370 RepID=UPI00104F4F3A|nr:hypothetical protein [Actinomadura sp. KC216]TDB82417.1 hypothetical protein E1264_31425 [Actinomadura sp. KC216]